MVLLLVNPGVVVIIAAFVVTAPEVVSVEPMGVLRTLEHFY